MRGDASPGNVTMGAGPETLGMGSSPDDWLLERRHETRGAEDEKRNCLSEACFFGKRTERLRVLAEDGQSAS